VKTLTLDNLYGLGGISSGGPRALADETFRGLSFDRLLFGPGKLPDETVSLRRCTFSSCVVRGEFRVDPGVLLDEVVFDDVRASDPMTISAEAALRNVVVKGGRKAARLWVKPSEYSGALDRSSYKNWARRESLGPFMLDFSELEAAEVEVVGLPLVSIRWSPERHVALSAKGITQGVLAGHGYGPTSFWRSRLKRLELFGVEEGVFSLPSKSDKRHTSVLEELSALKSLGLIT
jgi:hypothetical protein